MKIPFRKLYADQKELEYMKQVIQKGKLSGKGEFNKRCEEFIQEKYSFPYVTLTSSCTGALEMIAIMLDIQKGDEIIIPSFTFVSSANAFALRGAKIVFADCQEENPNVSIQSIERKITAKTKAIVAVHYAGFSVPMYELQKLAKKHQIYLIEDAAMAYHSYYDGKPLGSFGDFATFSFHETKNITSGEGGLLVINDPSFTDKSHAIRDKGTNRNEFLSGKVNKYEWVSLGSAYSLTELQAAFLFAQLQKAEEVNDKRLYLWNTYYKSLKPLEENKKCFLPNILSNCDHNGSVFYIILKSLEERNKTIAFLEKEGIQTAFHYQALHKSPYFLNSSNNIDLPNAERFSDVLLRLPLYHVMTDEEIQFVIEKVKNAFD